MSSDKYSREIATRTDEEKYLFGLLIETMLALRRKVPSAPLNKLVDIACQETRRKSGGIELKQYPTPKKSKVNQKYRRK